MQKQPIIKLFSHALILAMSVANLNMAYAGCHPSIPKSTPTNRFTILNGGSEVKDNATGLIWQRCSIGQTWSIKGCGAAVEAKKLTWHEALKEAHALGNGYRLPNIRELTSIVEVSCANPAINTTIFPNTADGYYWSSSPHATAGAYSLGFETSGHALGVSFSNGTTNYNDKNKKSNSSYVRAVRSAP